MAPTVSISTAEYRIHGLDCAEEVMVLRSRLGERRGIHDLRFDILKAKMIVDFDPAEIAAQQIEKAVAETGMRAETWSEQRPRTTAWQRNRRSVLVAVSGVFLLAAILTQGLSTGHLLQAFFVHHDHAHGSPLVVFFSLCAIAAGAVFVVPKAAYAMRRLQPDMNALVAISLIGAAYLGEWLEGASLAFLFALAGMLESWSMARARNAVMALMTDSPTEAAVIHGDHEHRVPVENVAVGARVRVKPGERVPCDGDVVSGSSDVNQAMITGESAPVFKTAGDTVYAGTVNGDGALEVRTTKPAGETALSRIVRMVERAQHHRAPAEHFVERFARVYTPAMLVLALLVAVVPPLVAGGEWGYWFYQCMVILLISCPCALVISTPVTVVAALTSATRQGILIKGGVYLEEAARIRAVALDKTGVLTVGHPEVRELAPLGGRSREEILARLAALEKGSQHPIAHAIVRYAEAAGIRAAAADGFQTVQGKGAEARIGGDRFWAGSLRMARDKGMDGAEVREGIAQLASTGGMTMAFGDDREAWALVALSDPIRPDARQALAELRRAGIHEIAVLTGDHEASARSVGLALDVEDVRAGLLPEDKAAAVDELRLRHRHIAMVGDGVNDAQAMTRATLGIAMGQSGVDAVTETADVVFLSGGLNRLPQLVHLGRRTVAIIHQNIFFALALKGVFLVLALFGMATLWMAVAADMGATLLVTLNGLRMLGGANRT